VTLAADLDAGVAALDAVFAEALEAALPVPAALTFSERINDVQGRRDLLFALGILNEGENEAALISILARDALRRNPSLDAAHMAREAWYYLRTSIDPAWQVDDGEPSFAAALDYLATVVRERTATLAAKPKPPPIAGDEPRPDRAALLRQLRATRRKGAPG
jgi:hypothetical protein